MALHTSLRDAHNEHASCGTSMSLIVIQTAFIQDGGYDETMTTMMMFYGLLDTGNMTQTQQSSTKHVCVCVCVRERERGEREWFISFSVLSIARCFSFMVLRVLFIIYQLRGILFMRSVLPFAFIP